MRKDHQHKVAIAVLDGIVRNGYLDLKRPLGNSGIAGDVAELIGLCAPPCVDPEDGPDLESPEGKAFRAYCLALYDSWAQFARVELRNGRLPTPARNSLEKRVAALEKAVKTEPGPQ